MLSTYYVPNTLEGATRDTRGGMTQASTWRSFSLARKDDVASLNVTT